jgi:hypothetical protein
MPLTCPMCGEDNFPNAVACEYCGETLSGGAGAWPSRGLWREGKTLVMEKNAELPNRCVKSNVATELRLKRRLSWHHPALFLLIFGCGLIPYIIVALIVRKQATIQIGLSDEWFAKRRRATLLGWGVVLAAIGLLVVGINLADKGQSGGFVILGAVLFGLFGAIFGLLNARMVSPKRITKTHVWLNGVCPEYLEAFPEWRGES